MTPDNPVSIICSDGWRLYDAYSNALAFGGKDEIQKAYDAYVAHCAACPKCTISPQGEPDEH